MKSNMLTSYVFLTQTDTTVGFVSQNETRLTQLKQRPPHKHYIKALPSFRRLQTLARVPTVHRPYLRRAKHTTFILPDGRSYRIIHDPYHVLLLKRLGWAYTTSANLSGQVYDEEFAKESADIVVHPLKGERTPSTIIKLGKEIKKRIR